MMWQDTNHRHTSCENPAREQGTDILGRTPVCIGTKNEQVPETKVRVLRESENDDRDLTLKSEEQHSRLARYISTTADDPSVIHLCTSLKHVSTDWRGGTWKQIGMSSKHVLTRTLREQQQWGKPLKLKQGCKEQEWIFQLQETKSWEKSFLNWGSFLNIQTDKASESTSLSSLVTNSDLGLRRSWVAFCMVTRIGLEVNGWINVKLVCTSNQLGCRTEEWMIGSHKLDPQT